MLMVCVCDGTPTVNAMKRSLLLLPLAALALAACGGAADASTTTRAPSIPAVTTLPPTIAAPQSDEQFKEAANASTSMMDLLQDATDEMGKLADAANDVNAAGVASHARSAVTDIDKTIPIVRGFAGSDGPLGQRLLADLDQCRDALDHAATAADNVDTDALSAAADEMTTCGTEMQDIATEFGS
jgi:hypothetical protein